MARIEGLSLERSDVQVWITLLEHASLILTEASDEQLEDHQVLVEELRAFLAQLPEEEEILVLPRTQTERLFTERQQAWDMLENDRRLLERYTKGGAARVGEAEVMERFTWDSPLGQAIEQSGESLEYWVRAALAVEYAVLLGGGDRHSGLLLWREDEGVTEFLFIDRGWDRPRVWVVRRKWEGQESEVDTLVASRQVAVMWALVQGFGFDGSLASSLLPRGSMSGESEDPILLLACQAIPEGGKAPFMALTPQCAQEYLARRGILPGETPLGYFQYAGLQQNAGDPTRVEVYGGDQRLLATLRYNPSDDRLREEDYLESV